MTRKTIARSATLATLAALASMTFASAAFAGTPVEVPLQGLLADSQGQAVDGTTPVTFTIYGDATSEEALWTSAVSIDVDEGLFEVYLGGQDELDSDLFAAHPEAHLSMTIQGDEESDRMRLGAVPFAAHAASASVADDAFTIQGQTPEELTASAASSADDVTFDDTQAQLGASNTQSALEALAQRIDALEQTNQNLQMQVADNDSAITTVEGDVTANAGAITTLQGDVTANTNNITSLQGDVTANTNNITTLQGDVTANTNNITTLQGDVNANANNITTLQGDVNGNANDITTLQTKTASMSVDTINGADSVLFTGVNVHIRNGSGATTGTPNGEGNLIVGYDEARTTDSDKSGSHNVVVGTNANYTSYGGFVGGRENTISGPYASVFTGIYNEATDTTSAVITGFRNEATGFRSAVVSGWQNVASGSYSANLAGFSNDAASTYSGIVAGQTNTVSSSYGAILGGRNNEVTSSYAAIGAGDGVINSQTNKFQAEGSITP